jgi:RNA methyltransferase, TrmH family
VRTISSRHNPLVARFRAAARGELAEAVLLDGVHLVVEALDAGLRIREVAVTAEAANRADVHPIVARLSRIAVDAIVVTPPVMDALSPVKSSTGIVAVADRPTMAADRMYGAACPLVVIGVDVQDPGNVGAIVRVVEAAGGSGFIAAGTSADPFGWKALRGSMGSALRLPIAQAREPASAAAEARDLGVRVIAAVPRDGKPLFQVDYTDSIAILIGGEGPGLAAWLAETAHERVTVPMQPPVESLNVAVTAAVVVYEAFRQRHNRRNRC